MSKKIENIFESVGETKFIQFLEENGQIQKMSPAEFVSFAQKKGNKIESWTDKVDFSSIENDNLGPTDETLDEKTFKRCLGQAKANLSKLAICFMNGKLGFGVRAMRAIKKGELIGLYSGVAKRINYTRALDQKQKLDPSLHYRMHPSTGALTRNSFEIDAYQKGNITRFIQHAFEEKERAEYFEKYDETVQERSSVAVANLTQYCVSFEGKNFVFLKAIKSIEKEQMLFYSYSLRYWEAQNMRPECFDLSGIPLKSQTQKYKFKVMISPDYKILEMAQRLGYSENHTVYKFIDIQYIRSYLQNDSPECILGKHKNELIYEIKPDIFKQSLRQSDLDFGLCIYVKTPIFVLGESAFAKCLKIVLQHQTGIEWKYNRKNELAFANVNEEVFAHLSKHEFKISKKLTVQGEQLFLNLKEEQDLKKLIEIPALVITPSLKDVLTPSQVLVKPSQGGLFKTYEKETTVNTISSSSNPNSASQSSNSTYGS